MSAAENSEIEGKAVKRREVKRFTFDTDPEQWLFMKRFSLENGVNTATVMRALMFRLEIDENLANLIIDDINAEY